MIVKAITYGCLGTVLLAGTIGALSNPANRSAPLPTSVAQPATAASEQKASPPTKRPIEKPKRVILSDLDESDRAIRLAINLSGHLCAKPIEVAATGSEGLYGVRCITHRDGTGTANYLVNSQTNEVTEI